MKEEGSEDGSQLCTWLMVWDAQRWDGAGEQWKAANERFPLMPPRAAAASVLLFGLLEPSQHSQDLPLGLVTGWITFTQKAWPLFAMSSLWCG